MFREWAGMPNVKWLFILDAERKFKSFCLNPVKGKGRSFFIFIVSFLLFSGRRSG
jgi:hypothetical protein